MMVKPGGDFRAGIATLESVTGYTPEQAFSCSRLAIYAKNRRDPRKKTVRRAQKEGLRARILGLLTERALNKVEISKSLNLPAQQRGKLRELLREMEMGGEVARDSERSLRNSSGCRSADRTHSVSCQRIRARARREAGQPDLFISAENTFTAMHGDRVVARLITERVAEGDWKLGRPTKTPRREGRVIRILERANETIVGTLQRSRNFYFVVADDPRFVHNLYVPAPVPPVSAGIGDKVVAKLDAWPSRHVNPEGHIVEVLGPAGTPGVDMLSIVRKYRLPSEFPQEVVREAESLPRQIDSR